MTDIAYCNRGNENEVKRLMQAGYEPFAVDNDATVYFRRRVEEPAANFAYTVLECLTHREFVAGANALGQRGWQLIDVEQPHGLWFGFFMRPGREDESEADPEVHDRTGEGVLATCGGL